MSYAAIHIRVAAADRYEALYDTGDARKDAYYANVTHVDAAMKDECATMYRKVNRDRLNTQAVIRNRT